MNNKGRLVKVYVVERSGTDDFMDFEIPKIYKKKAAEPVAVKQDRVDRFARLVIDGIDSLKTDTISLTKDGETQEYTNISKDDIKNLVLVCSEIMRGVSDDANL